MNYHKIEKTSVANGTGIRVVLWVSGCTMRCKGCHNPETWAFDSGKLFDATAKEELFEALDKPYIRGITFSGGHPLEDENILCVYELVQEVKEKYPNKDIWLYTGYTLDMNDFGNAANNIRSRLLSMCDVVVDGRYIEEQRDITLLFRGSRNQRLIDAKKTIKNGEIVQWREEWNFRR